MVALAFLVPLLLLTRELAADRALLAAEQETKTAARLVSGSTGTPEAVFVSLGFESLSLILPNDAVVGQPVPADEDLSGPRSLSAGSQAVQGGVAVYAPVLTGDGVLVLRSFVADADLSRNVVRSWLTLGSLAVILVGAAVGVANWLGRSIVRPVEDLSRAASALGEGNLDTRVEPSGPPELERVGIEFNHLARRVRELLQQERETAADLSHRLRTPLTAARLNAESLPAGEVREQLLDDLAELERTTDHIINEARRPTRDEAGRIDIVQVVTERAGFWDALAEEQGRVRELFVASSGPMWATVDDGDFAAAVDALIGNVFSHTDDGVGYGVALEANGGVALLQIDDEGEGFARPDVMDRGTSAGGSTGLGLDIARRTAEAAGGSLVVGASSLGGARVTMHIPLTEI
jgi:signal transduction histidine kinase